MKKLVNSFTVEGYLHSHKLETRTVQNKDSENFGKEFIKGTVNVATDEACTNIVPVEFTYVVATTKSGSKNRTFEVLADIIDGKLKTLMEVDKTVAAKVKINTSLNLNEWYDDKGELISRLRAEGGFINIVSELNANEASRNSFRADMVITAVKEVEGNPEKNTPDKVVIGGHIFTFRNEILPVSFSVIKPEGMSYFLGLDASSKNPHFTTIGGLQKSLVIKNTKVEANAFGEDIVTETEYTSKDFVVDYCNPESEGWDTEEGILATDVAKMLSDRQVKLATMKQRKEEGTKTAAAAAPVAQPGAFPGF